MIVALCGGDYDDMLFFILWSVSKLYKRGYLVIFHVTSQCFDWGMCNVVLMCENFHTNWKNEEPINVIPVYIEGNGFLRDGRMSFLFTFLLIRQRRCQRQCIQRV